MNEKIESTGQIAYYRARAAEYDEWHLRLGRYDRGPRHRRQWLSELGAVRSALDEAAPLGDCLELACGTGQWTPQLAERAATLTAVDAVSETIEINRSKIDNASVRYVVADIFEWSPSEKYDFVFFGFWLSHVPLQRFDPFWEKVRAALKPTGRAFFVDSLKTQESTARDHSPVDDSGFAERKLNDGRTFNIVKIFHDPEELNGRLRDLGWTGSIQKTGKFFYHGCMTPEEPSRSESGAYAGKP